MLLDKYFFCFFDVCLLINKKHGCLLLFNCICIVVFIRKLTNTRGHRTHTLICIYICIEILYFYERLLIADRNIHVKTMG